MSKDMTTPNPERTREVSEEATAAAEEIYSAMMAWEPGGITPADLAAIIDKHTRADKHGDKERVEVLPLCAGHAETWYCERPNLIALLKTGCWICDAAMGTSTPPSSTDGKTEGKV